MILSKIDYTLNILSSSVPVICFGLALIWIFHCYHSLIMMYDSKLFTGGMLSGGLHALTGADHLAALLPSLVGKKWWIALVYGGIWGFGHSLSSSILATCGYFLEDQILRFDSFMAIVIKFADFAIGLTLIIIGILGVYESTTNSEDIPSSQISEFSNNNSSSEESGKFNSFPNLTSPQAYVMKGIAMASTIFINGMLLGLSWDGLPSLAPALSADSYNGLFVFIIAYGFGTTFAMGVASAFIGFCTTLIGSVTHEKIPQQLAYTSSIIAAGLGLLWVLHACVKYLSLDDHQSMTVLFYRSVSVLAPLAITAGIIFTIGRYALFCRSGSKLKSEINRKEIHQV